MRPSVSIGLPVFNGERYIHAAVESILGQSHDDLELIISDNASTDGTGDIARTFAARDGRVRYMRNPENLGAAENYNRVFLASNGKYFKWAAHDDVCAPTFVEACVSVLDRDPSVILSHPRTVFIDEGGRSLGVYEETDDFSSPRPSARFRAWLFDRSGPWCNAVFGLIRADALARTALIGKFVSSDVILLGELLLRGRVARLPEALFYRRDHPERSVAAHADKESRAAWFDPASAGKIQMPTWRWLRGYAGAIARSPLSPVERTACAAVLARWTAANRRKLGGELVAASRKFRGTTPSANGGSARSAEKGTK